MAFESDDCTGVLSIPLIGSNGVRREIRCEFTLTDPVPLERQIVCTSGNNDIRPALTGATFQLLVIIPPPGIRDTLTVKGINGDTGFEISSQFPSFFAQPSSSNAVLNCFIGGYAVLTRWYR